jgi:outer membrane protein assembly factor BamB
MRFLLLLNVLLISFNSYASNWPVYKGNIFFTGNNDEIVVPNGNLKWLYQANDRIHNPVVSDGRVYFIDNSAQLYCLDERSGRFIWKINIREISAEFKSLARSAGKIKYPLIQGDYLYLTDPVAIYCLNKYTGKVLWARAGIEGGNNPGSSSSNYIYSDPFISNNNIFYGTRKIFFSRNLKNGKVKWSNNSIQSFSGFPLVYDNFVLVQSTNYTKKEFTILKLNSANGLAVWKVNLPQPFKIFRQ